MRAKETDQGLPILEASRRSRVPVWKIRKLILEKVIFAPKGADGIPRVSINVIQELPKLARMHFTPAGEFVINEPVYAEFKDRSVSGVNTESMRVIQ